MATLSSITANLSLAFLFLGLLFLIIKPLQKPSQQGSSQDSNNIAKNIMYQLHKAGPAIATILAFIHGFVIEPYNQTFMYTGLVFGLAMILLSGLGIIMGFKNKWIPYTAAEDRKYKKIRMIKWILTVVMIGTLIAHYVL